MANFLPPEVISEIHAGLNAGLSLRAVSRMAGVSTNTVRRYIPADAQYQCPCGGPSGHRGWCKHRYKNSAKRQAFHALRRGVVLVVPKEERRSRIKEARSRFEFIFGLAEDWESRATPLHQDEHYGVIGEVRAATRRVAFDIREDVQHSIILAVYEGRVQRHQIEDVVGPFVKYEMKNIIGSIWSLYISLETPLPNGGSFFNFLKESDTLDEDGTWRPMDQNWKDAA